MVTRRVVLSILTIVIGGAAAGGSPEVCDALELPGLATLLGTADPLAEFPDSLPAHGVVRVDGDWNLLYRQDKGPRVQNFEIWDVGTLALLRAGPVWAGWRYGRDRVDLAQREVWEEQDVLDGERDVSHRALALAWRGRGIEIRGLAGKSSQAEGGVEVRTAWGPLTDVRVKSWLWRGRTDLRQTAQGTTFYFPFEYRDVSASLNVRYRPIHGWAPRVAGELQELEGRKLWPDWYNLLDVRRRRVEFGLERAGAPRVDLVASAQRTRHGVEFALENTVYARTRDFDSEHASIELGWRPFSTSGRLASGRVALGWEGRRIESDDAGFVDVWPFTVWDVFTATRFRLENVASDWRSLYARVTWQGSTFRRVAGGVDVRVGWWDASGDLFWKKRVPVLPPFFFRFAHFEEDLTLNYRNGSQIDLFVEGPLPANLRVRVDVRQVVAFRRQDDGGGGDDPDGGAVDGLRFENKEDGGRRVRASLEASW